MDSIRIKVIVKEVTGGEKYFWSVIPLGKYLLLKELGFMIDGVDSCENDLEQDSEIVRGNCVIFGKEK